MSSSSDMRTPLGKVRGLGSAKSGTEHFWQQRVTAIANVPLSLLALYVVLTLVGKDFAAAKALLATPLVTIGLILFVVSSTYHMRLGMQIVIEDYVHSEGMKILALLANTFFTIAVGLACVFSLLKVSFGG